MMMTKIVADSSADLLTLGDLPFASVPLTIHAGDRVFVDDEHCDIDGMIAFLRTYKGKTTTSCPNTECWLKAFGDADTVYCVTISSAMSGTYNAAMLAAKEYMELHPERRVHVFDSLSAGPGCTQMVEKVADCVRKGLSFEDTVAAVTAFRDRANLIFSLASVHNFVANGRVSAAVGAIVGILGIRVIGKAGVKGELVIASKSRGDHKAMQNMLSAMMKQGWNGSKVYIHHCMNQSAAEELKAALLEKFPNAEIEIGVLRGLCSYYAEVGGVLVEYEGNLRA